MPGAATGHRRILEEYSPYLLDQMIGVVTASTLVAYIIYCTSPETIEKFGTDQLVLTTPFPIYGIFRYLYLVHQRGAGQSVGSAVDGSTARRSASRSGVSQSSPSSIDRSGCRTPLRGTEVPRYMDGQWHVRKSRFSRRRPRRSSGTITS